VMDGKVVGFPSKTPPPPSSPQKSWGGAALAEEKKRGHGCHGCRSEFPHDNNGGGSSGAGKPDDDLVADDSRTMRRVFPDPLGKPGNAAGDSRRAGDAIEAMPISRRRRNSKVDFATFIAALTGGHGETCLLDRLRETIAPEQGKSRSCWPSTPTAH